MVAHVLMVEVSTAYLIRRLRVQQDPSKLNDLGRVLGYIDAVLVTCGGYMDDYVAVEVIWRGLRSSSHGSQGGDNRGSRGNERERREGPTSEDKKSAGEAVDDGPLARRRKKDTPRMEEGKKSRRRSGEGG